MIYQELETDNLIEIDSVSAFISEIKSLRDSVDGTSTELYFRGQEVEFWDVEPSIFRNDMLSIEYKLMQIPLQKIPMEFSGLDSLFDVMTKYQHYGMCTRLLDLTTNPLVALYFACKIHGNEEYACEDETTDKEPYGVVYYTDNYYPSQPTDKAVKIVTALASYDLSRENTIGVILDKLKQEHIIDNKTVERWLKEDYIREFIEIVQRNYMVIPTYTNERLRRQNGVFLLASMFSVEIRTSVKDGVITKSKGNLREEFAPKYFYIRGENKEAILKELDLYNINEATLFPELEHQLNYIRYANGEYTRSVSEFFRFEKEDKKVELDIYVDDSELNSYIVENLEKKLSGIVEKEDFETIKNIIEENMAVDWYKRNDVSSKIKMTIVGYYFVKSQDKKESTNKANAIMAQLNEQVKVFIELSHKGGE